MPRLTRRGVALVVAGAALVVVGAFSGFTDLVRAGIFALLLAVLSVVLVLLTSRTSVRITHAGPRLPLEPGDDADIELRADVSGAARSSGATLSEPHTFGGPTPSWPVTGPTNTLRYAVHAPHRGRFVTGPTRLSVRDPFALAEITRDVAAGREILVWPRSHDDLSPERARSLVGDTSIESSLALGGEVGTSVRQYVRGDDMRLVHWPATARRGELIVRQLDPPTDETARARVLGNVATAGEDPTWEGLLEACASWVTGRRRTRQPFLLQIGDGTFRSHDEAMDALALADDCPLPGDAPTPLVLFVHADTAADPGPAPAGGHAYVAGSETARPRTMQRLDDLGWLTTPVLDAAAPAGASAAPLSEPDTRAPRRTARATEGAR